MLTAEDLVLSEAELFRLTGCKRAAEQLAELHLQGFTRARRNRLGQVTLERAHYESVKAGGLVAAAVDYSTIIPKQVFNASSAKRAAALIDRTPAWADLDAIEAVYAEARRMTAETGVEHHVDHIIPLQGALVSGLHVACNLRVLVGAENVRKSNRFEVE